MQTFQSTSTFNGATVLRCITQTYGNEGGEIRPSCTFKLVFHQRSIPEKKQIKKQNAFKPHHCDANLNGQFFCSASLRCR